MEIVSESDSSTCSRENVPVKKTSVRADSNIVEKENWRVESSDRAHFPFIPVSNEPSGRTYRWSLFYIRNG